MRPRSHRPRPSLFRGGGAVDRARRMPLALPAAGIPRLEHRVQAVPKVGEGGCILRMFRALAEDADFECVMIDGSIVEVRRHGQGAKGGLKARPSGALAAA